MDKKIIRFSDGTSERILSETGKYYVCKGRQFRKNNLNISKIEISEEKRTAEAKEKKED